jgi:hypothetical protein
MAVEVETGRFTVGVFQDIAWAEKGVDALRKQGLSVESLSIMGKGSPDMAAFIERTLGTPQSLEVHDLGGVMARGAIHSEPRAADALAVLHSYGGGNAAIGAWTGRV